MSNPFVYTPQPGAYTYIPQPGPPVDYYQSPYLAPFYNQPNSPFIPPSHIGSPYGSPYGRAGSLPPSPNFVNSPLPSPNAVPFPSTPHGSPYVLNPAWPTRERKGSWTGPAPPQNSPWLHVPRRQRTRSGSDIGYNPFQPPVNSNFWPTASPYSSYAQLPIAPAQFFLHPLLNAENRLSGLIFDLSSPQFLPMRHVGNNHTVAIPREELDQTATYPPIYRLHIFCERLPNWPIDMTYNPTGGHSPVAHPITVGDVLSAIYNVMRTNISQMDWAELTPSEVNRVSRVYTKRCRADPARELATWNEGVKKVDFLLGKIWFQGLERVGDGFETMKLIVA